MTLTVSDIERWSSESVREVFHAGKAHASAASDASDASDTLATLRVFDNWDGRAAEAAKHSVAQTRQDLDAHGQEMSAVADAARQAADDIDQVQNHLKQLQADCAAKGLQIDAATDQVVAAPNSSHSKAEMQAAIPGLQATLNAIVADANAVDTELAAVINMADGDAPIPKPSAVADAMSDEQIRDAVNDMLDGQDLSPAEREQLAKQLTDKLHAAQGSNMSADQAYGQAEDLAGAFMTNLHRSYVRKSSRLHSWGDARRNADGDILSDTTGKAIPAQRNANGQLKWFDKQTGKEVAEGPTGPPNSMTLPERGASHIGHEYGEENWRVLRQAHDEGWTQAELNDFMNKHGRYRVETPEENHGHAHEDHSPYEPNPDWTPERITKEREAAADHGGTPSSASNDSSILDWLPTFTQQQIAQLEAGTITAGGLAALLAVGVLAF